MSFRVTISTAVVLLISTFSAVHGYATGAPKGACQNLTPQHGVSPQDGQFPYDFSVASGNSVNVGGRVKVKISAESSQSAEDSPGYFKGFLLQARKVDGGTRAEGTWVPTDNSKGLSCGERQNSALTHVDNSEKTELEAEWQPGSPGRYEIYLTVVGDEAQTFWVGQKSETITVAS